MNNEYIFTPTLDIDLEKIKEIALRRLSMPIEGMAVHQRNVSDEPYLVEVKEKYPFLGKIYNIYPTLADAVIPIHICPGRGCGLNFPIQYTTESHTIFYKFITDNYTSLGHEDKVYDTFNPAHVEEVFRYTLEVPTLMNTRIPHSVISGPNEQRIILSWSIAVNFKIAKDLLGG